MHEMRSGPSYVDQIVLIVVKLFEEPVEIERRPVGEQFPEVIVRSTRCPRLNTRMRRPAGGLQPLLQCSDAGRVNGRLERSRRSQCHLSAPRNGRMNERS